jgi:hypothetical protein
MGQPSPEDDKLIQGKYTLIPVVSTPKINPGGKISIEYFVAGRHPKDNPPEYVRMNINLDGISVKSARVSQNIAQQWKNGGSSLILKKEEGIEICELAEGKSVFSLKLPEAMFFPIPEIADQENPYSSPPIHGELDIDDKGNSPYRLEIQTSDEQSAGDHEITSTLIYQQNGRAGADRVTNQIHVNSKYEEHQFLINTIIILLTLFGVFFPVFRFLFL